jgi:hypothetical protein
MDWKSAYEEKTRRMVWNGCHPKNQLVELSVDKEFCMGDCNKRTWAQEESPLLEAIARKRLVETGDTNLCVSVICIV